MSMAWAGTAANFATWQLASRQWALPTCRSANMSRTEVTGETVNPRLTPAGLPVWPRHTARLAAFWPHGGAQRRSPVRINE